MFPATNDGPREVRMVEVVVPAGWNDRFPETLFLAGDRFEVEFHGGEFAGAVPLSGGARLWADLMWIGLLELDALTRESVAS